MKTVNLELSKQLKEAGYPQTSTRFFYFNNVSGGYNLLDGESRKDYRDFGDDFAASPTADEILEQLPKKWVGDHPLWYLVVNCNDNYFSVNFETFNGKIEKDYGARADSLADAAAKMWLYLKKML